MNVWEWIPADLAVLPPNNGAPGTSGKTEQIVGDVGIGVQVGSVLLACSAGAELGALVGSPDFAIGAIPGAIAGCLEFAAADIIGQSRP
jgi:hypothetical protein